MRRALGVKGNQHVRILLFLGDVFFFFLCVFNVKIAVREFLVYVLSYGSECHTNKENILPLDDSTPVDAFQMSDEDES